MSELLAAGCCCVKGPPVLPGCPACTDPACVESTYLCTVSNLILGADFQGGDCIPNCFLHIIEATIPLSRIGPPLVPCAYSGIGNPNQVDYQFIQSSETLQPNNICYGTWTNSACPEAFYDDAGIDESDPHVIRIRLWVTAGCGLPVFPGAPGFPNPHLNQPPPGFTVQINPVVEIELDGGEVILSAWGSDTFIQLVNLHHANSTLCLAEGEYLPALPYEVQPPNPNCPGWPYNLPDPPQVGWIDGCNHFNTTNFGEAPPEIFIQ